VFNKGINHKTNQKYEKKQLSQWIGYAFPTMENFPCYETTMFTYFRISGIFICQRIANEPFESPVSEQFTERSFTDT